LTVSSRFVVAELGADVDPFILHLYASLAQKERELISQRTREALAHKKAQGAKLGNPPQPGRSCRKGPGGNHRFRRSLRG
jgi:DNA invertase Pin-like site-specific DNA recombinase